MRTRLTLDDELVARLESESRRSGRSFQDVVNEFLRRGLDVTASARPSRRFEVRARPLGVRPDLDYDSVGDVLEQIEGPLAR